MEYPLNSPDSLLASFLSQKNRNNLLILTGPSGSGKTTYCAEIVARARRAGLSVAGILGLAVFEGGKKVGIELLNIASGERRRLGQLSSDRHKRTTGCWWLDESVLAWGNEVIAALHDEDLILIDEIGPLELETGSGYQQALQLLGDGDYQTALVVVRPTLVPMAQKLWPAAQIINLEQPSP